MLIAGGSPGDLWEGCSVPPGKGCDGASSHGQKTLHGFLGVLQREEEVLGQVLLFCIAWLPLPRMA